MTPAERALQAMLEPKITAPALGDVLLPFDHEKDTGPGPTYCCGQVRTSKYCPDCGARLG